MIHWREAAVARRVGDGRAEEMASACVREVRELLGVGGSVAISWREEGDSIVIAFPSDRAADEVDVIVATVRRRGEDAPRR